ncbi:MAG TPA: cysteine desulfurase [Bacteroidales bacterium]|nr:cysteine desulfurase [Bacteroidales bacterium]HPT03122.1 cysteine desulfurase [Bacteroidales bacterium]
MKTNTVVPVNIEKIRSDFPILGTEIYGKPLIYFDNAATTQKPRQVIDAVSEFYLFQNSNVHRGVHRLSTLATIAFEDTRKKIAEFLNARYQHEIIFTRGTTESINLVAFSFGEAFLKEGDEVIISSLEHHSNLVPWQQVCHRKKAVLRVIPVFENGELDLEAYRTMLNPHTRMVAVNHISNSLGTINPVKEITRMAHEQGAAVLIDGAQAMSHGPVDVQDIGCDFYAFSAHKMYGPMGIGGLYGREEWLSRMPPYQCGGEMIETVSFDETVFNGLPYKFEAGTPNVADTAGFGAAIDYIRSVGWETIQEQESLLLQYGTEKLSQIEGVNIIGTAPHKASIISFLLKNIHFYDAGTIIDHYGIAVRTGNHCTQPLMARLGILGTIRASFSFYNTTEEIDRLVEAIEKVKEMFA